MKLNGVPTSLKSNSRTLSLEILYFLLFFSRLAVDIGISLVKKIITKKLHKSTLTSKFFYYINCIKEQINWQGNWSKGNE